MFFYKDFLKEKEQTKPSVLDIPTNFFDVKSRETICLKQNISSPSNHETDLNLAAFFRNRNVNIFDFEMEDILPIKPCVSFIFFICFDPILFSTKYDSILLRMKHAHPILTLFLICFSIDFAQKSRVNMKNIKPNLKN